MYTCNNNNNIHFYSANSTIQFSNALYNTWGGRGRTSVDDFACDCLFGVFEKAPQNYCKFVPRLLSMIVANKM